jgi:type IV secretory pathway TrbF-like protein
MDFINRETCLMAAQLSSQPLFDDMLIRQHDRRLWLALSAIALLAVLLGAANLVQTFRPRALPYVVMVGPNGQPVDVAHPVLGTAALNDVVIKWALMEFIRNSKTITDNVAEQKEMINTALAFVREQAAAALHAYYFDGKHLPWDLYQKCWIEVRITRAPLKLPAADTWEVDWVETRHDYGTDISETTNWRATMKVTVTAPDTSDNRDPLGLYITSLSWEPEVTQ